MAKYEVIFPFTDLRDYDHPYKVGDEFPRPGVTVPQSRFDELASRRNRQNRPLIQLVGAETPKTPEPPVTQTEQQDQQSADEQAMAPAEPQENPVQNDGAENGVKKYTAAELEELSVPKIRELAKSLGFKCSSISREDIVAEFLEKQG